MVLDPAHNISPRSKPGKKTTGRKVQNASLQLMAILMALLLLVMSGWYIFHSISEEDTLFSTYYKPEPGLQAVLSAGAPYGLEQGMVEYKRKNYSEAIRLWTEPLEENMTSDTLNFYLGSAHLALGQTPQSISYLEKVTQLPDGWFTPHAYWFLGLGYLKENRKEEAIQALEASNYPEAEELIKKIGD